MNPRILLVLALGAQTLLTGAAFGENKPRVQPKPAPGRNQPNRPAPERKEHNQEHTTISSINAETITISEGGKAKTFKITKDTEIDLKGQKVKAEDLKPGMRVSVSMGADATVASRINASDAPKEESHGGGDKKK